MLTRSLLLNGKLAQFIPKWNLYRCSSTFATNCESVIKEGPERDYVNFPDLKKARLTDPPKTRFVILPDDWFQFFYKKTGVTGPYSFGLSFLTYLLSKEIYVVNDETDIGIVLFSMFGFIHWKYGNQIYDYLKKQADKDSAEMDNIRDDNIKQNLECIQLEKKLQAKSLAQKTIALTKRENVLMQLETTYRKRLMEVYNAVNNRLRFHAEISTIDRRIQHKHMSEWIIAKVLSSLTPEQQKQSVNQCIAELANFAKLQK